MYARRGRALAAASGLAVVLAFASGCASSAALPRFGGSQAPADEKIMVEVHNVGWADVTVYSVAGGARLRLGMVTSNTTGRFELPRVQMWATDLRLLADPIGSAFTYESDRLSPSSGQVVLWTVHETESFRSLTIR